jgi:putative oxidoreductase
MVNFLDLLGRICIASIFLFSGFEKIFDINGTIQWMSTFGVSKIFLAPTIVLEIVLPILIIIGYKTKIASSLLSLFCLTTAFIFHSDFSDQLQIIDFLKNISLTGGLLFLTINGAKNWSLDKEKKYVRL